MRIEKIQLLKDIYALRRVTKYHLVNQRGVKSKEGVDSKRRNIDHHLREFLKEGFIEYLPVRKKTRQFQSYKFFQVTKSGAYEAGVQNYKPIGPFNRSAESFEHNYGLQATLSAIYYGQQLKGKMQASYPGDASIGCKPDAILTFPESVRIIEFENSKHLPTLVKDVLRREEAVDFSEFPKDTKWVYVINMNKHGDCLDPIDAYEYHYDSVEKTIDRYFFDLLKHPDVQKLPSHKYRFTTLSRLIGNGDRAVFYAPGKGTKLFKV